LRELLNRYTGQNLYRGFESLPLRQFFKLQPLPFFLGLRLLGLGFRCCIYTTRGTNGFYLVPLFGAAANFLVLMALWFGSSSISDLKSKTFSNPASQHGD
jgi:hypothetical protein